MLIHILYNNQMYLHWIFPVDVVSMFTFGTAVYFIYFDMFIPRCRLK